LLFKVNKFVILLLIFLTSFSYSQNIKISGQVTDAETGKPLVGANVTIIGTNIGASAGTNGHYSLTIVSVGEIKVQASMIGFRPAAQEVQLSSGSADFVLNFKLTPTVLRMAPVTITGESERNLIANPKLESPGLELSTSVMQAREIKQQGAKTVIEALKYVPGALVESRGRKVKQFFSIRGQRYPYPEYSLNGAWQREFHELPYFFSTADIERIEVVRSSAALLTGINGMAGVINIVTKEHGASTTSREIEYGSYGTYRAHLTHGAKIGNLSYTTGFGTSHTDGPADMNAEEGLTNFYGSVKWEPTSKLTVRYNLFHLNGKRELRLAVAPAAKRFLTEISRYDPYKSTMTNLKINYEMSDCASTEFLTYYADRDPVYVLEDPDTHEIKRTDEQDYEWGANLVQSVSLGNRNVLRLGGLYNHWVAPNGKRFYVGRRNDLHTLSGVIVDEHRFESLILDAGLRWSKTYIDEYGAFNIEGSGKKFSKVDPGLDEWEPGVFQASFGAAYALHNLTSVHVNAALGQIQPRRGSLDVDLTEPQNETRLKLDVGLRSMAASFGQVSFVGFMTSQKNALVLSGKTHESEDRIMELYLNREQEQYGVELDARITSLFSSLQGFFNLTAMKTKAKEDESFEENKEYPELITSGGLYYQYNGIDITAVGKHVSSFENSRFAAPAADGKTYPQSLGDYFVADLNAGYSMGSNYITRFYVEIKNIFDKEYSTVVGYPDFGRTISVGLRQSF
jgi:outer membrane receptor protein involved in Fe transport